MTPEQRETLDELVLSVIAALNHEQINYGGKFATVTVDKSDLAALRAAQGTPDGSVFVRVGAPYVDQMRGDGLMGPFERIRLVEPEGEAPRLELVVPPLPEPAMELARAIDFAVDVTEPRDVRLRRFADIIGPALLGAATAPPMSQGTPPGLEALVREWSTAHRAWMAPHAHSQDGPEYRRYDAARAAMLAWVPPGGQEPVTREWVEDAAEAERLAGDPDITVGIDAPPVVAPAPVPPPETPLTHCPECGTASDLSQNGWQWRAQMAEAQVDRLEHALRQHAEAGAIFQPGGKYHGRADLLLGSSTVVDGMRWLDEKLTEAEATLTALRAETPAQVTANALLDEWLDADFYAKHVPDLRRRTRVFRRVDEARTPPVPAAPSPAGEMPPSIEIGDVVTLIRLDTVRKLDVCGGDSWVYLKDAAVWESKDDLHSIERNGVILWQRDRPTTTPETP